MPISRVCYNPNDRGRSAGPAWGARRCTRIGAVVLLALGSAIMSLDIRSSKIAPDILVLQLAGNLTLVPENQITNPFITGLLDSSVRKLVIDLAGIEHMDSSGMQLLVQCSSVAKNAGGALLLAAANPRVARLFQITRLDSVLPMYPTVAAACEGFAVGPK